VLIVHGSAGIDSRGDFYEAALNEAGIATLQIDMWQARGYNAPGQRPAAIYLTYPDAFSALRFLSQQPNIDASRIGVLGFSWGGLVSMGAAERLYSSTYGNGLTFKAHVRTTRCAMRGTTRRCSRSWVSRQRSSASSGSTSRARRC
jgi:dienelactone hydrolase